MNDELLIKFLLQETSEEENIAVQEWLAADEANMRHFIQFEKIWTASKKLHTESNVDETLAWNKFKEKTVQIQPLKKNYSWLRVAAVFLLAIGIWATYSLLNHTTYVELSASNQVITKNLPDGSAITLNKKSQLSYASDFKNKRSVKLHSGDVFFSVAHDKTHPFIIEADDVEVEVVGTSFNVKHQKNQTEVIVETGIVKVSLGNEEIKLIKGERVLISSSTKKLIKEQNTDQLYNYYRSKIFVLNKTPLWKIVPVLNEAYDAKIILDPAVKDLTLNTTLKMGSLDHNLLIICQTLNLNLSHQQQEILLSSKKQ